MAKLTKTERKACAELIREQVCYFMTLPNHNIVDSRDTALILRLILPEDNQSGHASVLLYLADIIEGTENVSMSAKSPLMVQRAGTIKEASNG